MIIESFEVECFLDGELIYEMNTVFGFFPAEALANQVGLPISDQDRERFAFADDFFVNLKDRPAKYFAGPGPVLPEPMLCMVDRVTSFRSGDKSGDATARAILRGEKDVDPDDWFFKAHFFQDPVQPGSLGLEALLQLLQFYMIETNMAGEIADARFEPIQIDAPIQWKYRGQVIPKNKLITSDLRVLETGVGRKRSLCPG